jgi:predicted membrane protein
MDFALVGGREFTLQQDWDHEFLASVLGGTHVKASATTFPGASITVVTVVGATDIQVPRGSRIRLRGFTLLGSRKIDIHSSDGPEITVRAFSLFGPVTVNESPN